MSKKNIFLKDTYLFIQIFPVRVSTCNLHGGDTTSGLSMLVQHVQFKQFAKITTNLICSSAYSLVSHGQCSQQGSNEMWLEVGGFGFGPICVDAATSQLKKDAGVLQENFLKIHDNKFKKLWFLWGNDSSSSYSLEGKCGCIGGCTFFGTSKNGASFFSVNNPLEDGFVNAKYHLSSGSALGFGESLLHKGHFVFEIPEILNAFCAGYSPTHSEVSFNTTEISCQHSINKTHDSTSKSSDTSQFIGRGQSAFSESFLIDKASSFHQNKSEPKDCPNSDLNTYSSLRETKHNQMRKIKRQYSSPTHMSMPSSSSILSSYQISMAQSVPISSKHDRILLMKSDELKNAFEGGANFVKEGSVSPGLSQNRNNSRASLNACVNSREGNGSRHSLANIAARNYSPRSIRRAASTESTHSTESFFSADEDAMSSIETTDTTNSDEVHIEEDKHPPLIKNGFNSFDRRVSSTRRSLHDIQETPSQISSESDLHVTVVQQTPSCAHHDPSDSNSVSSTSFLSAVSSQEDIALVDLHNQMDKPIIESPLLMSCYMAHMTQLQCHYWFQHPPLPHLIHQQNDQQSETKEFSSSRAHSSWKPKFTPLTEGFTSIHMIDKTKMPYYRQKLVHQKATSTLPNEEFQPGSLQQEIKKGNIFYPFLKINMHWHLSFCVHGRLTSFITACACMVSIIASKNKQTRQ